MWQLVSEVVTTINTWQLVSEMVTTIYTWQYFKINNSKLPQYFQNSKLHLFKINEMFGFEVLTAEAVNYSIRDMAPCGPLAIHYCFWEVYRIQGSWYPHHAAFFFGLYVKQRLLATCFMLVSCSGYSPILKMEAICSYLISINFKRNTWCYIPEDRNLHAIFAYNHEKKIGARNGIVWEYVSVFTLCSFLKHTSLSTVPPACQVSEAIHVKEYIRGIQTYR
jgi:hypothetical protein